ncbi:hypothetical protein EIP86_003957 [Pleurotus ostreatoroseus]|nr:hypothetical protein EIP86_003957 [Pleurotus ostreatoroseus]
MAPFSNVKSNLPHPPDIKLDSQIWWDLPRELLTDIVDWLVVGHLETWDILFGEASKQAFVPALVGRLYFVSRLRLVCRHWCERFRPYLWWALETRWGMEAETFVSTIQTPGTSYTFARKLHIRHLHNIAPRMLLRISVQLPSLEALDLTKIDWGDAACAHPSWGRVFPHFWMGFKFVTKLQIRECVFPTPLAVLRVLATLPSLTAVDISELDLVATSSATKIPGKKHNQLCRIRVYDSEAFYLPSISFWILPHSPAPHESLANAYCGLKYEEARILTRIMECTKHRKPVFRGRKQETVLERSPYPLTWTLAIKITDGSQMEFSISQHDDNQGHIRWIVFRFQVSLSEMFYENKGEDLVACLSQLPHLDKIILEYRLKSAWTEVLPSSWKCDPIKDKFYIWSHKESRLYIRQAATYGLPVSPAYQVPVSSMWSDVLQEPGAHGYDVIDAESDDEWEWKREMATPEEPDVEEDSDEEQDESEDGERGERVRDLPPLTHAARNELYERISGNFFSRRD